MKTKYPPTWGKCHVCGKPYRLVDIIDGGYRCDCRGMIYPFLPSLEGYIPKERSAQEMGCGLRAGKRVEE